MTTTRTTSKATSFYHVGDRVHVQRDGQACPGRISSIHPSSTGVEYVIAIDDPDGGVGGVVNIWTTSGRSSFLTLSPAGDGPR